ncbi:DUF885 domain-containing protein [Streptomyces sp. SID6673]|nr:DUF885 domain-containing protein [Streptomyces sp. SID11726]NEB24308.1 DUF885 domain-containing protein [Streptomyces sp. SID6673]
MSAQAGAERLPTPVDRLAEAHLAGQARLDPLFATEIGIAGHDHLLTDFSPDACAARVAQTRSTVRALADAPVTDDVDRVTVATMTASLRREIALAEAGERVGECNVIASPLQAIRDVFDLMPTDSAHAREIFLARLQAVPGCVDTVIDGLRYRTAHGPPATRRQVGLVADQALGAAAAIAADTTALADDPALAGPLRTALDDAAASFDALAAVLRTEVMTGATSFDAVGRERYLRFLPAHLGADIDPDEAYAWGLDHLAAIVDEQSAIARDLVGSGDVREALAHLDTLPRYAIEDRHAFVGWMQELSDRAVEGLAGTHFDIPARLTRLECRLAPSSTGIIYYTQPSADLARPGRMWWSVPPEQTVFHTWQETTTVFHEGVPGHHLQLGSAVVADDLNAWRKLASFTSGHGEGWALYAERLMGELGWLDDPGDRMGMLDSQRLRAARVIVDIGVHCGLPAPAGLGGGAWDAEKAWQLLTGSVAMDRAVLRFELNRYLGWPGQAPSYALGQRVWAQTRTAARAAHPEWTLKDFHAAALALGGVSLDVLADELTRT